jgi:hypothetical protein
VLGGSPAARRDAAGADGSSDEIGGPDTEHARVAADAPAPATEEEASYQLSHGIVMLYGIERPLDQRRRAHIDDFPTGVSFRDITPLLGDARASPGSTSWLIGSRVSTPPG